MFVCIEVICTFVFCSWWLAQLYKIKAKTFLKSQIFTNVSVKVTFLFFKTKLKIA